MKKVAIQGYAGSYHEEAMNLYFGRDGDVFNCDIFPEVLSAVRNGVTEYGIIAIANNRYGFIPEPYDLLMQDTGSTIQITGEIVLAIEHQLLGMTGATIHDITEIHSQTPALGQCRQFIENYLPNVTILEEDDTALAATKVAKLNKKHVAAIASAEAGKINGLVPIVKDIQDDENNLTRFLIIVKKGAEMPKDSNKTSILLETNNSAGSLADALLVFKEAMINLDLLHSTFIANSNFTMRFFLEFDAGWPDEKTQYCVNKLTNKQNAKITLLGSYKAAEEGENNGS